MLELIILGIIVSIPVIGFCWEYYDYNHSKCRKCGHKLKLFDYDSQGGRGYMCEHCENTVWVSYPVD